MNNSNLGGFCSVPNQIIFLLIGSIACLPVTGCGRIPVTQPTEQAADISGVTPAVTLRNLPDLLSQAGPVDPSAPEEFSTTDTGLQYRILRRSDGPKPTSFSTVSVDYRGWLDDGTIFDSSWDRGQAVRLNLSGVVPGWREGLKLIGEGGMIELWIPSDRGYGQNGKPPVIPPNAALHFVIELHQVVK